MFTINGICLNQKPIMRRNITICAICSFAMMFLSTVSFSQSTWKNYNDSSGLTVNHVYQVASDKFDNIWASVRDNGDGLGLDKFDGYNWMHYDSSNSALPFNDVLNIKADSNAILWINSFSGAGLAKFDGLNCQVYNTSNSGILSDAIYNLIIDSLNNVWTVSEDGLSRFDGNLFTNYPIPFPVAFPGRCMTIQDSANIWIGAQGLWHFNPISIVTTIYNTANSNIPSDYCSSIAIDSQGLIWMGFNYGYNGGIGGGGGNGGFATFDGTSFTSIMPFQSNYTGVEDLIIDGYDNVWASTRCEGLYKFDGLSWVQITGPPLTGCSYGLTSDNNNNIWYAEVGSGIWTNKPTVGIDELIHGSQLNIFPNPTSDKLNVKIDDQTILSYKLFSVLGKEIKKSDKINSNQLTISLEDVSAGVYFISLETDKNEIITKPIIKSQ